MRKHRRVTGKLPTALIILLAAAALLPAVSACSQQKETGNEDDGVDGRTRPRPGPVASSSQVLLTPEEVRDRTGGYMALDLWTGVARRTAGQDPGNFHQTLFSEPDLGCVEQHRELMKTTPTPPLENLMRCSENSAARGRGGNWKEISPQEREERARRSAGLLFWSIDPPSLVSAAIAHDRGLDVSVRTNPEFARFAAEYDACEDAVEGHAMKLAKAETPEQMAETWLRAEEELKACSDAVTHKLFK